MSFYLIGRMARGSSSFINLKTTALWRELLE